MPTVLGLLPQKRLYYRDARKCGWYEAVTIWDAGTIQLIARETLSTAQTAILPARHTKTVAITGDTGSARQYFPRCKGGGTEVQQGRVGGMAPPSLRGKNCSCNETWMTLSLSYNISVYNQ